MSSAFLRNVYAAFFLVSTPIRKVVSSYATHNNGLTERFHAILLDMTPTYTKPDHTWPVNLPFVRMRTNCSPMNYSLLTIVVHFRPSADFSPRLPFFRRSRALIDVSVRQLFLSAVCNHFINGFARRLGAPLQQP